MRKSPQLKTFIAAIISACLSLAFIAFPGQAAQATTLCSTYDPFSMVLEFAPQTSTFELQLPLDNFSGDIDWGDGDSESNLVGDLPSHEYLNLTPNNPFYVCITGTADSFGAPGAPSVYDPNWRPEAYQWEGVTGLTRVSQWGSLSLLSLASAFNGADHLYCVADNMTDPVIYMNYMFQGATNMDWNCSYPLNFNGWDTSHVKTMSNMFSGAAKFDGQINAWDTSNVENMNEMFADAAEFNQALPFVPDDPTNPNDHAKWDTSSVEVMSNMFDGALSFNANINNWDTSSVALMNGMFRGAEDFNQNIGSWDTSNVLFMQDMFEDATSFNRNLSWNTSSVWDMNSMFAGASTFQGDISTWDTSSVSDMSCMFCNASLFDSNIGGWDTSNVENMGDMFAGAAAFNQDISGWDTHNVANMSWMFAGASLFNKPLDYVPVPPVMSNPYDPFAGSKWYTGNVTSMESMFEDAISFNQDLSSWNTSNVGSMSLMFNNADNFDGDISSWDTSSVVFMDGMFDSADSFDQDISQWDTSSVEDMTYMFAGSVFNQPIGTWDTSSVIEMSSMFEDATLFNQDLSNWDTTSVEDMSWMFAGASSFNQDLSNWSIMYLHSASSMFDNTNLSTLNYSKILRSWASQPHQTGVPYPINFGSSSDYFNTVEADRQALIDDGWDITDGGSTSALTPTIITPPTASSISVGQHLGDSDLTGGSSLQPGVFEFTNPNTTPTAGTFTASVTLYPDDDIQFLTATTNVSVVVNAAPAPTPTPTPTPTAQNDAASLASTGSALGWVFPYPVLFVVCGLLIVMRRRKASRQN